jgi:hypothetical protein
MNVVMFYLIVCFSSFENLYVTLLSAVACFVNLASGFHLFVGSIQLLAV